MNDKIVPIKGKKELPQFLVNRAKCLTCKHEWTASAPVGTVWLQCPVCSFLMGRFIGPVQEDGNHWHCSCGNDLFHIKPEHVYCPVCGVVHEFS